MNHLGKFLKVDLAGLADTPEVLLRLKDQLLQLIYHAE